MQLSCLMWCASSGFWFWFPPVEWGLSWPSSSWSWRSLTRICMGTGKWARNCGVQKSSDGWLIRRALKNHREEVVQSRNIYSRTAVHNGNVFPKRRLASLKHPALMRIVPSLPDGNHLISGIKLTNRAFPIMRPNLAKVYLSYTLSPIFQSDSSPPKKTHTKNIGAFPKDDARLTRSSSSQVTPPRPCRAPWTFASAICGRCSTTSR